MKTIDTTTLREWLDLDLEGQLGPKEKAQLEKNLEGDAALRAEREELAALHRLLAADRLDMRPDFAAQVMAALPAPAWRRSSWAWLLPAAMVAFFAVAGALVLSSAPSLAPQGPVAGTAVAIAEFLATSVLAGAGLLAASWRGLGLGLEELFAESRVNLFAFGLAVLFLNLLFIRMLRRPAAAESDESSR